MVEIYGDAGAEWFGRLPELLAECARRWHLEIGPHFEPLTYNYVAPVTRQSGEPAVLKVGFPCRELGSEAAALRCFGGRGAVRLLDADESLGAMLLERLEPGGMLRLLVPADDAKATAIAAGVMRGLWRRPPDSHTFPSVADWAAALPRLRRSFEGGAGPLPRRLFEQAESLFADLLSSAAEPALLHGDLHHDNILASQRDGWLAIDPKGVVGEPAFEVGAFLQNPLPELLEMDKPSRVLAVRLKILAEALGLDVERLRGWGIAHMLLSACWTIEDHGAGWEPTIAIAELLAGLSFA